jgi:hypothetical protein
MHESHAGAGIELSDQTLLKWRFLDQGDAFNLWILSNRLTKTCPIGWRSISSVGVLLRDEHILVVEPRRNQVLLQRSQHQASDDKEQAASENLGGQKYLSLPNTAQAGGYLLSAITHGRCQVSLDHVPRGKQSHEGSDQDCCSYGNGHRAPIQPEVFCKYPSP